MAKKWVTRAVPFLPRIREVIELKIRAEGDSTGVVDVYQWLNFAALETMGEAGFGYSFDALESGCEVVEYLNASHDMTTLLFKLWYITPILPWLMEVGSARFRRAIVNCIPFGPIRALRNAVDILNGVATKIYRIKKTELDKMMLDSSDYTSRDVMSLLLMQNNIVAPEEAMDENEVISQVNALIFAAHDSTSAALARTMHILAEHPDDIQSKLRREISEAYETYGEELTYDQLNSLPYLDAVCRESLRLYPPGLFLIRIAQEDWNIPLLYPGKSSDGQEIAHIPVKKGSYIYLSLDGANRDERTWGEDSNEFRPSRWLDPATLGLEESRMPGIYSSLMTFSGGPRACIGFKFSQLEMKLLLAKLVFSFKFELADVPISWRLDSVPKPYVQSGGDEVVPVPSMPMRVTILQADWAEETHTT